MEGGEVLEGANAVLFDGKGAKLRKRRERRGLEAAELVAVEVELAKV